MPKQIVLCFDGTGEKLSGERSSTVGLIYGIAKDASEEENCFYQAGIGTPGIYSGSWLQRQFKCLLGLALGYGLRGNVLRGYRFLSEHYQEGAEVFIFGFSRGAYTARVLIGMIAKCGLLDEPYPTVSR